MSSNTDLDGSHATNQRNICVNADTYIDRLDGI
jgi:hypothetical protein